MEHPESAPRPENKQGLQVRLYTPTTLRELGPSALPKFQAAVNLLRASIEELRDINGVQTTDGNLKDHEIIYPAATSTAPTLRLWDSMLTEFTKRTPFLIALEDGEKVVGVCEGRIYPLVYNKAQVEKGNEQPMEETAIFIEQIGVEPDHRGNKEENVVDRLYREVYTLADAKDVTLLIGAVNRNNARSRRVVERQGRHHITVPPLDDQQKSRDPDRWWPHPEGAYLKNPEWDDTDSSGNPIHVVVEYYTQRLGSMPEA